MASDADYHCDQLPADDCLGGIYRRYWGTYAVGLQRGSTYPHTNINAYPDSSTTDPYAYTDSARYDINAYPHTDADANAYADATRYDSNADGPDCNCDYHANAYPFPNADADSADRNAVRLDASTDEASSGNTDLDPTLD